MGIYKLMRKKMRYVSSASISALIMILFSLMTGNSVSAVRAVIMFVMHVVADVLGRKYDMLSAISLSALILLVDNPYYIINAAFILSYAAMLAVAVTAPITVRFFRSDNGFLNTIIFNLSMTFTSMPIMSCLFYRIPTYSILLNIIVVPLMGVMLAMAIVGMVVSVCSMTLGTFLIGCSVYILRLYEGLSVFTKGLPWSSIVTGDIDTEGLVIYYIVLLMMLWLMWKCKENKISYKMTICMLFIVMLYIVYSPKQSEFEMSFLDVGQGDGIYIHSATGNDYLIDCGSTDEENVGKYKLESFLEYKDVDDIEYVFISHCDTDHISGIIELIERGNIAIKCIVLPATERLYQSDNGIKLLDTAYDYGIEIEYFGKGSSLNDGELELVCVSPDIKNSYDDINEASMALMIRYRKLQAFFAGDIGEETEKLLLDDIGIFMEETAKKTTDVVTTIYKVAHHGSKYSSCTELLELLKPDIAIISCGEDNSYGHPHEETLRRLEQISSQIFMTKDIGAIVVNYEKELMLYGFK